MSKVITLRLNRASIEKAIQELKAYQKWLKEGVQQLVEEMAKEGVNIASVKFSQAQYDGTNDVQVTYTTRGQGTAVVHAGGNAVLFIEFGTGIRYPDNHPEAAANGMVRGEYGYGLGKLKGGWHYDGDPGTNGEVVQTGKHAGRVHTFGNPANMPMYLTERELETKFSDIARRVFSHD